MTNPLRPPGWTLGRAIALGLAAIAYAGFGAAAMCGITGGLFFFPMLEANAIFFLLAGGFAAAGLMFCARWLMGWLRRLIERGGSSADL